MAGFIESFGLLFLTVVVVSLVVKFLRQPIIIGYVLSGILFGILFSKENVATEQTIVLSELGITFLLFLMGIEFDLKSLKYLGKDIFISTLIQSVVFFCVAYLICSLFGVPQTESVYLSILFMFSSTLLVANLLEEKKETQLLSGKIILGTLVVQDFFAITILTLLYVYQQESLTGIIAVPAKGLLLITVAIITSRYLLGRLLGFSSKYPELLYIVSLGICFSFVELAAFLDYSTTIGAFIGGITVANTIYKNDILSRLRPLVAFFNLLFFVGLGFEAKFTLDTHVLLLISVLCAVCFAVKPIVTYATLRFKGYDTRTAWSAGIHLAQFSEFGIIIIGVAVTQGMVPLVSSPALLAVIATMILSSYFIKYEPQLYAFVEPILRRLGRVTLAPRVHAHLHNLDYQVVLFGYYDLSHELIARLRQLGKKIIVIEHDPEHITFLKKEGIEFVYNSVHNPEFFREFRFKNVELVLSSLQRLEENITLIKELRAHNPALVAIVTARTVHDALELYNHGADYVIYADYLHEERVSVLLEDYTTDINRVLNKKAIEITKLREKQKRRAATVKKNLLWDIDNFLSSLTNHPK